MSDLINRQAAISLVHKNYDSILDFKSDGRTVADSFEDIINTLPPAQPEIIRCEDCKHRYTEGENVVYNMCELNHNKAQPDDWFCGDAERREE